jgi:transposase InsO family protein
MEGTDGSFKKELWHRRSFADAAESIEVFCHRDRLHSSLGYVSPAAFESQPPAHTVNKS